MNNQLRASMLALKAELKAVIKDATNPHFRSRYADLNSHLDEVEPLATKHSLILTQATSIMPTEGGRIHNILVTRLTHAESGESEEASLLLPDLTDMQKLGSAITYARRYTLSALLAMKAEDDDGNDATGNTGGYKPAAAKPNKAAAKKTGEFDF